MSVIVDPCCEETMQEFNDLLGLSIDRFYLQCLLQADLWHYRDLHSRRVGPVTIADYLLYFKHLPSDTLILYTNGPFAETIMAAKEYLLRPKGT
jgi:hypothetical protein